MKTIVRSPWIWRTLAAGAFLAMLAGCSPAAPEHSGTNMQQAPAADSEAALAAQAPAGAILARQQTATLQAWLSCDPTQPVRGTADMDAYLIDMDGQPVTDAQVTFDIDMTNMSHGILQVTAMPAGDGHYVGQVYFSMPGPWRLIAIVERPDHEAEQVRFDFKVNR